MTDRDSVHRLFDDVVLAYGGMDTLIVTAGIFFLRMMLVDFPIVNGVRPMM